MLVCALHYLPHPAHPLPRTAAQTGR